MTDKISGVAFPSPIIRNLVHQYIGILNTLSEEHNQEKMYSDYSKAFNKLNHSTLLLQAF